MAVRDCREGSFQPWAAGTTAVKLPYRRLTNIVSFTLPVKTFTRRVTRKIVFDGERLKLPVEIVLLSRDYSVSCMIP